MNRRRFVGQVVLGSAALAVTGRSTVRASQSTAPLTVNFVGMMMYVTRSDGSLLIALPGAHPLGHYAHVPFMMARAGSRIANALAMKPMPGVVPGAFDQRLADAPANSFVFRCLDGVDLDIESAKRGPVDNRADQLAHLNVIASGKRLRGDLRRWCRATVSISGGALENAAAHPDAGKIWSFGGYRQALTDATVYRTDAAAVRVYAGADVDTLASNGAGDELWVVSAAGPRSDVPDPKRLEHGLMLFEFFDGATPIVPTCEDAVGRITVPTEIPCSGGLSASLAGGYRAAAPPYSELCPGGTCCV